MKLEIISQLEQAKSLIRNEQNWMQGNTLIEVRNEMGKILYTKYCAAGALNVVDKGTNYTELSYMVLDKVANMMGYEHCVTLNDKTNHSSVLTMFNLAIQFVQDGIIPIL